MAQQVKLREITNEEGNCLLRIIRRTAVARWSPGGGADRPAGGVGGMPPSRIGEVVFSDPDTVREVIHNFNRDGFEALYPRHRGGRPRTFTLPESTCCPSPAAKAWAPRAKPRPIRATYTRPHGVRHLLSALDVGSDLLIG